MRYATLIILFVLGCHDGAPDPQIPLEEPTTPCEYGTVSPGERIYPQECEHERYTLVVETAGTVTFTGSSSLLGAPGGPYSWASAVLALPGEDFEMHFSAMHPWEIDLDAGEYPLTITWSVDDPNLVLEESWLEVVKE